MAYLCRNLATGSFAGTDRIVFLSKHPGTTREILTMEFKQGNRIPSTEELIETPGYHEIERKILHRIREEAGDVDR